MIGFLGRLGERQYPIWSIEDGPPKKTGAAGSLTRAGWGWSRFSSATTSLSPTRRSSSAPSATSLANAALIAAQPDRHADRDQDAIAMAAAPATPTSSVTARARLRTTLSPTSSSLRTPA